MSNGRCRIHGGKSLAGIASATLTQGGRYSKNLPTRMMATYNEARANRDYLNMAEDIGLLDSRLEDVLAKVDTGESGETWRALQEAVTEFDKSERKASSTGNEKTRADAIADREEAMRTIIVLVQAGMSDYAAWSEVKSLLEQRRKTVDSEHKRLVSMQQMMTADQAQLYRAKILSIIKQNVHDRHSLSEIAKQFALLDVEAASRGVAT